MSELSQVNTDMRMDAIRILLRNHPDLAARIIRNDGIDLSAKPDDMELDDPWDTMLRLVWDIWNGAGETEMDKVLNLLPHDDFEAFVDAMKAYGALRNKIKFLYASGSQND